MFPLMLLAISSVGFMLEAGIPIAIDAQSVVLKAVDQTLPQAGELVEHILITTRRTRGGTGLLGLLILVWSASNIFTHLRLALNVVWDTGLPQGLSGVLRLRLIALALAAATGLLLILFTLSDIILEIVARVVTRLPWSGTLWPLGRPVLIVALTVVLFAFLYRFLPRAALSFSDVWPGAIVAAVGWELLKRGFVLYATSVADWTQLYGPIAGVIGLLLWLYLSAQVLLFGAEFSAAYGQLLAEKHTSAPLPSVAEPSVGTDGPNVTDPISNISEHAWSAPEAVQPTRGKVSRSAWAGAGLARGTVVGLVGAGVASGLVIGGLLTTGRRFLTRRTATEADEVTQ
jgi:membrane protein